MTFPASPSAIYSRGVRGSGFEGAPPGPVSGGDPAAKEGACLVCEGARARPQEEEREGGRALGRRHFPVRRGPTRNAHSFPKRARGALSSAGSHRCSPGGTPPSGDWLAGWYYPKGEAAHAMTLGGRVRVGEKWLPSSLTRTGTSLMLQLSHYFHIDHHPLALKSLHAPATLKKAGSLSTFYDSSSLSSTRRELACHLFNQRERELRRRRRFIRPSWFLCPCTAIVHRILDCHAEKRNAIER